MPISLSSLHPVFFQTTVVPQLLSLVKRPKELRLPQNVVNNSEIGVDNFILGLGGVLVVALALSFGRLPLILWFAFNTVWTAAGCAGSGILDAFMAFHILSGLFLYDSSRRSCHIYEV